MSISSDVTRPSRLCPFSNGTLHCNVLSEESVKLDDRGTEIPSFIKPIKYIKITFITVIVDFRVQWNLLELIPSKVCAQKYSRLRCLLCVKGSVICFYLGWSGSILQFRQNMIKVGLKSYLLAAVI